MNDNAGGVDDRLNTTGLQCSHRGPNKINNRIEAGDFVRGANHRKVATDKIDDQRTRQSDRSQCLDYFRDRWNVASRCYSFMHQRSRENFPIIGKLSASPTVISGFRARTILPITVPEKLDGFKPSSLTRSARTVSRRLGLTHKSNPPLVWASVSKTRRAADVFFQSVILFAVFRLSRF